MHGLPGSGKSCAQLLLLNEDPPHDNVTNSTPIAHSTVRATITRVSVDDKKWERVTRQELLHRLASDLNDTAVKRTDDEILQQSQVFNHSVSDASTINKTQQQKSNAANDDPRNVINDEVLHIPRGLKGFKGEEEWLYIIDSGGQPTYQELLPLFTRAASLNIITIDLSKPLDEEIELTYRTGGKSYKCHSKSTQLTSFQSAVSSGSIYKTLNISCIKEQPSHSMHLVLGTHYDKVNKSTFEERDNTLMESMKVLGPYLRDCVIKKSNVSVIFPVNTLAKGEERTKHSQEICKAIYTRGSDASLTIEIPIRWFAFELSLPNISIITLNEALGIGKKYKMNEEDTKLALNYLHDVTLILYYPEVLDGVVFTDPQPILKIISQLLALTYIDDNEALQEITAEGKKLSQKEDINKIKDGYFKEELFHKLKSSEMFDSKFSSSDLLKLLLYLNIIAEVQEKNEYFIPYALPSYSTISNLILPQENDNHSKPLRILYWNETDDQILPIPQGIFPQTIVRLLNQTNYKVTVPSRNELEYYKYRDAMSLRIEINSNDLKLIHIINNFTYIEVYYTGPMKDCLIVRELVMKAVRDSSNAINVEHAGYLYSAFGSQNKGSCIVTDEKNLKTICPESPSDKCTIDNRTSCWFNTNSG